ncbi:MAG TPA: hypothetical protein VJT72_00530 [Pseudonocardiaceae bacterium]|nr:hypothetical protein [Pseudonocardiaceae bacterium]
MNVSSRVSAWRSAQRGRRAVPLGDLFADRVLRLVVAAQQGLPPV